MRKTKLVSPKRNVFTPNAFQKKLILKRSKFIQIEQRFRHRLTPPIYCNTQQYTTYIPPVAQPNLEEQCMAEKGLRMFNPCSAMAIFVHEGCWFEIELWLNPMMAYTKLMPRKSVEGLQWIPEESCLPDCCYSCQIKYPHLLHTPTTYTCLPPLAPAWGYIAFANAQASDDT